MLTKCKYPRRYSSLDIIYTMLASWSACGFGKIIAKTEVAIMKLANSRGRGGRYEDFPDSTDIVERRIRFGWSHSLLLIWLIPLFSGGWLLLLVRISQHASASFGALVADVWHVGQVSHHHRRCLLGIVAIVDWLTLCVLTLLFVLLTCSDLSLVQLPTKTH